MYIALDDIHRCRCCARWIRCVAGCRVVAKDVSGVLRFIGRVHFEGKEWCGIELDQPQGTCDGVVGGKDFRLFDWLI